MRRILLSAAWAFLFVATAACQKNNRPAPPDTTCDGDEECPGEKPYCSEGTCVECIQDPQCSCHERCTDSVCVQYGALDEAHARNAHGVWLGTPGEADYRAVKLCTTVTDCKTGEFCNPLTGGCLPAVDFTKSCTNGRCTDGLVCEPTTQKCLPPALCMSDFHCCEQTGFVCDSGLCQQTVGECTPPATPENVSGCLTEKNEEECSPGMFCSRRGQCVQCTCRDDCSPYDGLPKCWVQTGRCQAEDYCTAGTDCPSGQSCDTRVQACAPYCNEEDGDPDNDCSASEYCHPENNVCRPVSERPCTPDELEPNQNAAEALSEGAVLALPEVGGLTVIEDLTLCDDLFDIEDWFVLQLVAGDHLLIYGSSPTTFSAKLELYLPDGVTPIDDGRIAYFSESVELTADINGDYLLRVVADHGVSGVYDLTIERSTGTVCTDDFELDHGLNNTAATAASLNDPTSGPPEECGLVGTLTSAHTISCDDAMKLCVADADYYLVQAPAGHELTFSVTDFASDLQLHLYGPFLPGETPAMERLLDTSSTGGSTEAVQGFSRTAADYLVRVMHRPSSFEDPEPTTYDVSVSTAVTPACSEDLYDAESAAVPGALPEPQRIEDPAGTNDTAESASFIDILPGEAYSSVTLRQDASTALTLCRSDTDWYRLGVSQGESLVDVPAGKRIVARLIDRSSSALTLGLGDATTAAQAVAGTHEVTIEATTTGAKYARVSGASGVGSYKLEIEYIEPPACNTDSLGDESDETRNDVPSQAFLLDPSDETHPWPAAAGDNHAADGISLCATDDDWYAIDVPEDAWILVTVRGGEADEIGLALFNDSVASATDLAPGVPPTTGRVATSELAHGFERVLGQVSGRAHLMVYNRSHWPVMSYSLDVRLQGAACVDDTYEENDTWSTAKPVVLPVAAGSNVQRAVIEPTLCTTASGEQDWFAVPMSRGDEIKVVASYVPTHGTLVLQLYARLAAGISSALAGDYDVSPLSGYLEVDYAVGETGSEGNYLIRVSPYDPSGTGLTAGAYALELEVTRACMADAFGESSRDNPGNLPWPYTDSQELTLCREEDWYRISLPTPGEPTVVAAMVEFDSTLTDIDLIVFDGSKTNIVGGSMGSTSCERASFTAVPGEEYFARVFMTPSVNIDYSLVLDQGSSVVCP